MEKATIIAARLAILAAGVAVGWNCVHMAWDNGLELGSGFEYGFAGMVAGSWFLLPIARTTATDTAWMLRAGFAVMTLFVIANAIFASSAHLDSRVSGKANIIAAYDLAVKEKARLDTELEVAKVNARWKKTAGCTDITVPQSDAYCSGVRDAQRGIEAANTTIRAGRPVSANPGGERLASVLRADVKAVDLFWPVFVAIAMEVGASMCMLGAFAPIRIRTAPPVPTAQNTQVSTPEPVIVDTSADLVFAYLLLHLAEHTEPAVDAPTWLSSECMSIPRAAKVTPFKWKIDRRTMRSDHVPKRASNDA